MEAVELGTHDELVVNIGPGVTIRLKTFRFSNGIQRVNVARSVPGDLVQWALVHSMDFLPDYGVISSEGVEQMDKRHRYRKTTDGRCRACGKDEKSALHEEP